jgi:glycosyltransferase involved in cell wall biosynthesis
MRISRGLQNKVLEAMAMHRPVVATSAVAGGLHVSPGRDIIVADDAETFAAQVVNLCRRDDMCDRLGSAGYRCVTSHYDWADALERYERIVLGVTETGATQAAASQAGPPR